MHGYLRLKPGHGRAMLVTRVLEVAPHGVPHVQVMVFMCSTSSPSSDAAESSLPLSSVSRLGGTIRTPGLNVGYASGPLPFGPLQLYAGGEGGSEGSNDGIVHSVETACGAVDSTCPFIERSSGVVGADPL